MVALFGLLSFADTGSKFDLTGQPEYEELLTQRIAEQEELIRARNEYWKEHPEAFTISEEENQIIYPRTFENTGKEKRFNVKESVIEPHILDNGETGLYLNQDGEPWKLDAGDTVQIKIGADIKHFNSRGYLMWGYDTGRERILIDSFYIKEEKSLEFEAPTNGEYTFFLTCGSSDPIIIKYLLID
jgi:hypothetical protein